MNCCSNPDPPSAQRGSSILFDEVEFSYRELVPPYSPQLDMTLPEYPTTQTKGTQYSYAEKRESIFSQQKREDSCFHFSFRREWANVNVHSSIESFWGRSWHLKPPPPHDISSHLPPTFCCFSIEIDRGISLLL